MSLSTLRPTMGATFFRPFRDDADWWAIRELLVRTHANTGPDWNWDIRRWDGRRRDEPHLLRQMCGDIGLWEHEGRLVGAAHREGIGDAWLELDPDFRHLVPAMLDWAEGHLAIERDGRRVLQVMSWDYDLVRASVLCDRGYERTNDGEWTRIIRLGAWRPPDDSVTSPYLMRTTSRETLATDSELMADLLNAAFGRTIHTADEYLRFAQMSPSFDHDLNLVAEAPDGHLAAHVGVTYDATNHFGIFEPVCTDPRDLRHDLARALMYEGMRRLTQLGATHATVGTGDMIPANALYRACGFTEEYRGHWWEREL